MRWVIFVIDGDVHTASRDEMQQINVFNDHLIEHGHFELAIGIAHPEMAKIFDYRNVATVELDKSLDNFGNFYSGLWIINAPDRVTAESLARVASHACNRRVELRPVLA